MEANGNPYEKGIKVDHTLLSSLQENACWHAFEEGSKAGIEKVVRFADQFAGIKHNPEWKTQLKKWGIGRK